MSDNPSHEQLQPDDTLEQRGVDDILDEGYSPPERPMILHGYGTTAYEQAVGEGLDRRLAHEVPEAWPEDGDDDEYDASRDPDDVDQIGGRRAGRLVAADDGSGLDDDADAWARDVGIDGAGASAEEAAMHVIDDE